MKSTQPHQLLVASRHSSDYSRLLHEAGLELEITSVNSQAVAELISQGNVLPYDLFFGEPSLLRPLLPYLPKLYWAQVTWAGVETLLDPDLPRQYILTNARGVYGKRMVEYVFGYLLAHERGIIQRWQAQQVARWDSSPPGSLHGKTLGLLGVGSIGAVLARTAQFFGMRVHGYTRQSEDCHAVSAYFHPPNVLNFVSGLDYLVAVLPNTQATRSLVDAELLNALPPHAVFINAGRGSCVDELALEAALRAGKLALAVLDVFVNEPLPPGHPFWNTPNLWITNHTAALNFPPDLAALFIQNYQRLQRGEPLLYRVDFTMGY